MTNEEKLKAAREKYRKPFACDTPLVREAKTKSRALKEIEEKALRETQEIEKANRNVLKIAKKE